MRNNCNGIGGSKACNNAKAIALLTRAGDVARQCRHVGRAEGGLSGPLRLSYGGQKGLITRKTLFPGDVYNRTEPV